MINSYNDVRSQNYKNTLVYNQLFNNRTTAVDRNTTVTSDRTVDDLIAESKRIETEAHEAGYTSYNVTYGTNNSIYKDGYSISNGTQQNALDSLNHRSNSNDLLNQTLKENNIQLSPNEKLTLTIDKDLKISVSGIDDKDKMAKIEDILNNKELSNGETYSWSLLSEINSVRNFNGIENPLEDKKWYIYTTLKNETGLDFNDLKLENGKIIGNNDKLSAILDGSKKRVGLYYIQSSEGFTNDLKALLSYDYNNIEDMNRSINYQNGSLEDKDVVYGYGSTQTESWFNNLMTGKSSINSIL